MLLTHRSPDATAHQAITRRISAFRLQYKYSYSQTSKSKCAAPRCSAGCSCWPYQLVRMFLLSQCSPNSHLRMQNRGLRRTARPQTLRWGIVPTSNLSLVEQKQLDLDTAVQHEGARKQTAKARFGIAHLSRSTRSHTPGMGKISQGKGT